MINLFILFFILSQAPGAMALAPPPINFTKEKILVEGKVYDVEWKDNNLTIEEERPGYNIFAHGILGCLYPVIISLWLWSIILLFCFGEWRLALQVFAVGGIIFSFLIIKWFYIDEK